MLNVEGVGPVHLSPAVNINIFIANTEFIHESLQQIQINTFHILWVNITFEEDKCLTANKNYFEIEPMSV